MQKGEHTAENVSAERPLLSFVVFAFNQEAFIREAVAGAFAQTYSPLEIVLSDDCSTDRTYAVMQEMAEAYRGPHQVRLNRNEQNQGLIEHVNRMLVAAGGLLVVVAAGDDVSLPERTETIYRKWLESGKRALAVCSSVISMDENGVVTRQDDLPYDGLVREERIHYITYARLFGCSAAYHRDLVRLGPLTSARVEDYPLFRRARLIGDVLFIAEPLVRYRLANQSISSTNKKTFRQVLVTGSRWLEGCAMQLSGDAEAAAAKKLISADDRVRICRLVDQERRIASAGLALSEGSAGKRWASFITLLKLRNSTLNFNIKLALLLFPWKIADRLISVLEALAQMARPRKRRADTLG